MSATNRAFRRRVRAWQRAKRRVYRWRVLTSRIVMGDIANAFLLKTAELLRRNQSEIIILWGDVHVGEPEPVAVPKPDRRKA